MLERELIDAMFVQRWGIVRTIKTQSIAEHSWAVAAYANDISILVRVPPYVHLAVMQYSILHDIDEIITGDLPGPNKRGLIGAVGDGAKERWDEKLKEWTERIFPRFKQRSGMMSVEKSDVPLVKAIVKCADWLEASTRMATEYQMGNGCTLRHIEPNMMGAIETVKSIVYARYGKEHNEEGAKVYRLLVKAIEKAVKDAKGGQSLGPWITREDDSRTYHDPCVDTPETK